MEPLSEEIKEQIDAIIKQYKNINKNDDWDDFFKKIKIIKKIHPETKNEIEKIKNNYIEINNYIETIIDGINGEITKSYSENDKQIDIKTFDDIITSQKYNPDEYELFVDNYCKVSHIIYEKKI